MKNNIIFILFVLVWIFTIQSILLYYYHYFNSINFKNPKNWKSLSNEEVKLQKLKSKYKWFQDIAGKLFIIRAKNQ